MTKKTGRETKKGNGAHSDLFLKLEMKSNPEALCLVRATLQRATEALHFQEADSRAIIRSVDEALANVIRHAYRGKAGLPIEVTCRRLLDSQDAKHNAGIEIVLVDSGVAAKPEKLHGRALDDIRPGGLGLHFMKQSMDKVEFSRRKGKNRLRLVKYLAPATAGAEIQGE